MCLEIASCLGLDLRPIATRSVMLGRPEGARELGDALLKEIVAKGGPVDHELRHGLGAGARVQAPPRDVVAILGLVPFLQGIGLGGEKAHRAGVAHPDVDERPWLAVEHLHVRIDAFVGVAVDEGPGAQGERTKQHAGVVSRRLVQECSLARRGGVHLGLGCEEVHHQRQREPQDAFASETRCRRLARSRAR